jgi:hypothetical protein
MCTQVLLVVREPEVDAPVCFDGAEKLCLVHVVEDVHVFLVESDDFQVRDDVLGRDALGEYADASLD